MPGKKGLLRSGLFAGNPGFLTAFIIVLPVFFMVSTASTAPTFEIDSIPYEIPPYFRVLTNTIELHEEPFSTSSAKTYSIKKNSIVSFPYRVKMLLKGSRKKEVNTEIILYGGFQRVVKPGIRKVIKAGSFEFYEKDKITNWKIKTYY